MKIRHFILTLLLIASPVAILAAPPDLTNGGVPGDSISFNMGATGARGWVYHVRENSSESRQIQIRSVAAGSPAAGIDAANGVILAANDVILGANGSGSAPSNFTYDARRALADAINDAEARNPATLDLIRWRAGTISNVTLTLRTLGTYSATAPYNCPKSSLILEEGLQYIMNSGESAGAYSFGTLSLIAGNDTDNPNNTERRNRAQAEARAKVPSATVRAQMMADVQDTNGMITWERGHTLIMLAEYYLLTGDTQVLPGIEAYAVNIAKNHSLFGTTGHRFARRNPDGSANGALGNGYGAVNSAAMPCYLGLLLAKKCGLTNPEIDPAIQRSSRFYAYYTGKGAVPYGEHEAYWQAHENNGKSGLAALCFRLEPNRVDEARFHTRMAVAGASERGEGHTGAFFNYVWSPLGAAVGGQDAAASHFSRIRWMLDLNRKWDGSFDYDCLSGEGPNSGSQYNDFRMSTAALLTYALPLRQLHITGKIPDPAHTLDSATVAASAAVDAYNPDALTISQLITDLGNWSPRVHRNAAIELATRTLNSTRLGEITALANDTNGSSRYGAIFTLGKIVNSSTAAARASTLVALLTDADPHVRFMAAEAMRSLPQSNRSTHLNTIMTLCASQALPLLPLPEEDPMQLAHGRLCTLFTDTIGSSITGLDRNLLLPAIRAVAYHPTGYVRSALPGIYNKLNETETLAIADAVVDSIYKPIPADRMFGKDTQAPTLAKLAQYRIAEVVPISKTIINREDTLSIKTSVLSTLQTYAGAATSVEPDPEIIPFLEMLKASPDTAAAAQAVLDAIAANPDPAPAVPLKSIPTISIDAPVLTLPANQTVLRATGFDHAKGDSVFTWRKVHGKGNTTFTPNGTAAAKDASVAIDALPGQYLFEVTLSDSRGLTETSRTVALTLYNNSGTLPPNAPPLANPQLVTVPRGIAAPITLTGADPDAYPLTFRILSQPADGTISGIPPNLTYTASTGGTSTSDSFTFEVMDSEGQIDEATVNISINNAVSAGAITWGAATNTTGPTQVATNGTLVASRTGDDASGTITVNSVPFAAGKILGSGGSASGACPDTGSGTQNVALESLLDTISWNGSSFQLSGLTVGSTYLIQIFLCDYRVTTRQMILGDTAATPNTVTLNANPAGAFGQHVIGTFIASSSTQTIAVTDSASGVTHLSAWQLRLLPDNEPPSPSPATWASPPTAVGTSVITMAANPAYDGSGVEYYFDETSGNPGGSDSGWQDSPSYTDSELVQATTYTYLVRTRDKSPAQNEGIPSTALSATTEVPDTLAPQPNPSTWDLEPNATSVDTVTMTATSAVDASGVEYYFDETSGHPGGNDSGWQDSPIYIDSGLTPGMSYTYTVRSRDKSPFQNPTTASAPVTVVTPLPPAVVWNVNIGSQVSSTDDFAGGAPENPANPAWNSITTLPANGVALVDADNNTNTVTLDVSRSPTGDIGTKTSAPPGTNTWSGPEIFQSYIGGSGVVVTATFNNLTVGDGTSYDLVVYSDWFWAATGNSYPINQTLGSGLAGTAYLNRPDRSTSQNGLLSLDEDTSSVNAGDQGNWIRLRGLTPDATGKLRFTFGGAGINQGLSGLQLIETGTVVSDDYDIWASTYAPADLTDPEDDLDGDGMTNNEERSFGLDPTSGSSSNPISVPFDPAAGTFSYTRRNPALTNLSYTIWTSTTLGSWTEDATAVQTPGPPDASGTQIVGVALTPGLLAAPSLFVRVRVVEAATP